MKSFIVDGFFTKREADNIKAKLDGKTLYNWDISFSNCCGNYTLTVATEYPDSLAETKRAFLWCALVELSKEGK